MIPLAAVSVVLPTYQRRDWVCRAVRSVFAQRYTDWELIVVDDGSTDGTEEALRAFGARLRYLWQENRGVSAARNAGLRLARGEIVAFLDSDDRWLPDHLQSVAEAFRHSAEIVLVSVSPDFHPDGRHAGGPIVVDALRAMLASLGLAGYTSSIAVRRASLVEAGCFDEQVAVAEDHHLWLRLAGLGPFCFVPRRTFIRQVTRGSLIARGIRSGEYVRSFQRIASAAEELADGSARGTHAYVTALRALAEHDPGGFRSAIAEACRRFPELSDQPEQVAHRITRMDREGAGRLHGLAAELWPDPSSSTALFLRGKGVVVAVRRGRGRAAGRLLARWPLRPTPGFLVRNRRMWRRVVRRVVEAQLYRGQEPRPGPIA